MREVRNEISIVRHLYQLLRISDLRTTDKLYIISTFQVNFLKNLPFQRTQLSKTSNSENIQLSIYISNYTIPNNLSTLSLHASQPPATPYPYNIPSY